MKGSSSIYLSLDTESKSSHFQSARCEDNIQILAKSIKFLNEFNFMNLSVALLVSLESSLALLNRYTYFVCYDLLIP